MKAADPDIQHESSITCRATWFAGFTAAVLLLLALTVQQIWSPDTWWQLRTGQWVLEHGAFPQMDQLSYTVRQHQWIELRWLFCVAEYLAWHVGGSAALVLGQTVLVGAAFGIIAWPSRRALQSWLGLAVLMLGIASGASRYAMRPELVTYMLVSVFLVLLSGVARDRFPRAGLLLPVLQIAWVNTHTLFVFGPVLAWAFAGGDAAQRVSARLFKWPPHPIDAPADGIVNKRLVALALLTTAACWVNPYGGRGAMFPLVLWGEIQKDSVLGHVIEEFRSPLMSAHWTWDLQAAAALTIVAFILALLNWRRLDLTQLMLLAAHTYLALVAVRNVGMLTFIATWSALRSLQQLIDRADAPTWLNSQRRLASAAQGLLALAASVSAWYVASDRFAVRHEAPHAFGTGVAPWSTAAKATEFMLKNGCQPNIFHSMADGAYLAWAAQDRLLVHLDGRLEVYGEQFVREYVALDSARWDAYANHYRVNTVLIETSKMAWLARLLFVSPQWSLVHIDGRNMVFVRRMAEHQAIIQQFEIDPAQRWNPNRNEPDVESAPSWKKIMGGVGRPWQTLGMARAFIVTGSFENAIEHLERGLEEYPKHTEMSLMLASLYRSLDRANDADQVLLGVNVSHEEIAWANDLLELLRAVRPSR